MRFSLIAGAVIASALVSGGTAVAAESQVAGAQSLCFVVAKRDTPIFDIATESQVGTLKKGKSKDSACKAIERFVNLKGDKTMVFEGDVSINARV
ncbi:hypothetical protein [Allokutzneria sp. NRRL B-24872]|uniref:hypothetical protein n=1 Tax=Allokutzneria sp. NRRL B-24872 TaxID=1137961 RepID=UPI000A3C4ACF|nr:hypothetical protein [Allokutzneria sp. NRRL B-24872]